VFSPACGPPSSPTGRGGSSAPPAPSRNPLRIKGLRLFYDSEKSVQNHPENRFVPIFVPSDFFRARNRPDFTEAIAQSCFAECVKVSAGNGVRNHVVIVVSLHENHTVGR
jgi:hypothetical protein